MSSKKKVGVLRFLGTNCDQDMWKAVEAVGLTPEWLWYENNFEADDYQAFIIPGGFSYGDYLRCGALAARSPVVDSLKKAAAKGYPVLGVCNGFQILCEAGLLPGALIRNDSLRFIDDWVTLKLENPHGVFASPTLKEAHLPIAHGEGRFVIDQDDMKKLEDKGQVWWRYKDNPNGSLGNIAGVMNEKKNVAALMPHPERAIHDWMGGKDGESFFTGILKGAL